MELKDIYQKMKKLSTKAVYLSLFALPMLCCDDCATSSYSDVRELVRQEQPSAQVDYTLNNSLEEKVE